MIKILQKLQSPVINKYHDSPSELGEYDIKHLQHEFSEEEFKGIYEYRQWGYEWTWVLIGTTWEKWYKFYLGHCSCYWPLENLNRNPSYTKEDILKLIDGMLDEGYSKENIDEFRNFVLSN